MTARTFSYWFVGVFGIALAASLGLQTFGGPTFGATSVFTVFQGGTGVGTFGQGLIYSPGGTTALTSTTSPTVGYITATSTTATSTYANGISLSRGCFRLPSGTCLTSPSGNTATVSTLGYTMQCFVRADLIDPASNSAFTWCGLAYAALQASTTNYKFISIPIVKTGTITAVYNDFSVTPGSSELATTSLAVNGLSTTTVSTVAFNTANPRANSTTLYIPVVEGDRIYMTLQTPSWSVAPTSFSIVTTIYIQATTTASAP